MWHKRGKRDRVFICRGSKSDREAKKFDSEIEAAYKRGGFARNSDRAVRGIRSALDDISKEAPFWISKTRDFLDRVSQLPPFKDSSLLEPFDKTISAQLLLASAEPPTPPPAGIPPEVTLFLQSTVGNTSDLREEIAKLEAYDNLCLGIEEYTKLRTEYLSRIESRFRVLKRIRLLWDSHKLPEMACFLKIANQLSAIIGNDALARDTLQEAADSLGKLEKLFWRSVENVHLTDTCIEQYNTLKAVSEYSEFQKLFAGLNIPSFKHLNQRIVDYLRKEISEIFKDKPKCTPTMVSRTHQLKKYFGLSDLLTSNLVRELNCVISEVVYALASEAKESILCDTSLEIQQRILKLVSYKPLAPAFCEINIDDHLLEITAELNHLLKKALQKIKIRLKKKQYDKLVQLYEELDDHFVPLVTYASEYDFKKAEITEFIRASVSSRLDACSDTLTKEYTLTFDEIEDLLMQLEAEVSLCNGIGFRELEARAKRHEESARNVFLVLSNTKLQVLLTDPQYNFTEWLEILDSLLVLGSGSLPHLEKRGKHTEALGIVESRLRNICDKFSEDWSRGDTKEALQKWKIINGSLVLSTRVSNLNAIVEKAQNTLYEKFKELVLQHKLHEAKELLEQIPGDSELAERLRAITHTRFNDMTRQSIHIIQLLDFRDPDLLRQNLEEYLSIATKVQEGVKAFDVDQSLLQKMNCDCHTIQEKIIEMFRRMKSELELQEFGVVYGFAVFTHIQDFMHRARALGFSLSIDERHISEITITLSQNWFQELEKLERFETCDLEQFFENVSRYAPEKIEEFLQIFADAAAARVDSCCSIEQGEFTRVELCSLQLKVKQPRLTSIISENLKKIEETINDLERERCSEFLQELPQEESHSGSIGKETEPVLTDLNKSTRENCMDREEALVRKILQCERQIYQQKRTIRQLVAFPGTHSLREQQPNPYKYLLKVLLLGKLHC